MVQLCDMIIRVIYAFFKYLLYTERIVTKARLDCSDATLAQKQRANVLGWKMNGQYWPHPVHLI